MTMAGARLRAGYAVEEITPERSVPMGGYGRADRHSTGTRDPLSARALVLADGATRVAVVSADLVNVSRELSGRVAREVTRRDGADVDELLVAATHTHSGPYVPARAMDVNPSFAPLAEACDAETVDRLVEHIADAVGAAADDLAPASLRVGRASNEQTPANRRADTAAVRIPLDETVDPELVVALVAAGGREVAVFNFACHPVCQTPDQTLFSADWLGAVYDRVADEHGAEAMFLNGASGQINPREKAVERTEREIYEYTDAVGAEVADTVGEALAAAREEDPVEDVPVSVERRRLRFPVKSTPDADRLDRHLDELRRASEGAVDDPAFDTSVNPVYVAELRNIAEWDVDGLPATMRYLEVGPVGVLTVPGEAFVQHGLAFKERATAEDLLVATCTDGYVGYFPTLRELENNGYEVNTAKVAPEAIVQFRDCGLDLVSR